MRLQALEVGGGDQWMASISLQKGVGMDFMIFRALKFMSIYFSSKHILRYALGNLTYKLKNNEIFKNYNINTSMFNVSIYYIMRVLGIFTLITEILFYVKIKFYSIQ